MSLETFLNHETRPLFTAITPEIIEQGIPQLLQDLEREMARIEECAIQEIALNDINTVEAFREAVALVILRLQTVWGRVVHLLGVANSDELRDVYSRMQPQVVQFGLRVSQSRKIYELFDKISTHDSFTELEAAKRRFVDQWLLAARQSGVALSGDALTTFNNNQEKLAQYQVNFSNHVLDDMKVRGIMVGSRAELDGVPDNITERCKEGDEGIFIPINPTITRPILQHAHDHNLRRRLYSECLRVASAGDNDNHVTVDSILELKRKQSALLGYDTTAAMYLEPKMAREPRVAIEFLEQLLQRARPVALEQFACIEEFASRQSGKEVKLALSDMAYWSERLREEELGFSVEKLRPYFPFHKVLAGCFELISLLFGVNIKKNNEAIDVWHPDVMYFLVEDKAGQPIASFYLDAFVRPENKRSGAWMGICRYGYKTLSDKKTSLPVAYVICNQTPLDKNGYSLMAFEEVLTLFHEFGHALHLMLAQVDGVGTSPMELSEWDAIEIQSQFMENWCYEPWVLKMISGHWESGEELSDELISALCKDKIFFKGHQILRQIHLALTDLYIYQDNITSAQKAMDIYHSLSRRVRELPPVKDDLMLCAFNHIFSGGYTAGYYSYLWSQVLSADLFGAFKNTNPSETRVAWQDRVASLGHNFNKKFFQRAGAIDPLLAFEDFMGRKPDNSNFLTANGL